MIAFLVVTSIVNLALGYALAVYLGAGGGSSTGQGAEAWETPLSKSTNSATSAASPAFSATNQSSWMQNSLPPLGGGPAQPAEPAKTRPTAEWASQEEEVERREPLTATNGAEQDLLAGIEEFRNQLAQLKAQNFDEPMGSPFAGVLGGR